LFLYYITDRSQFPGNEDTRQRTLLSKIAEAARCGVELIQLREKDLNARELEALARAAVAVVGKHSRRRTPNGERITRVLINSRTDIAIASGADGVHLRSDDILPSDVRNIGAHSAGLLICVSCHSVSEVARAASDGADFAVFAPVFEKQDATLAKLAGLDELRKACRLGIPVLALGGVTLSNFHTCLEAGASGIAAIRLFQQNDITEIVRRLKS
jgi:thiamine-phosphate pyrophosphorylase